MRQLSEIKSLSKLAWPLFIAQLTQTLMGVSDTIMAGRVSSTDMAAVAIASSIMFPCMIFLQGLLMALPPIISRLHGAKEKEGITNSGHQAFWLAVFLSIPFFILSFFTQELVAPLTMETELKVITADYLRYVFAGFPAFLFYQVLRQYGEGLSITKPSMIIMFLGLMINIPANYIFINGKLGLPAFGGAGCGIATTLVFCVMLLATWQFTKRSSKMIEFPFFSELHPPKWSEIRKILKIGIPTAFTLLFEVTLFAVVAILLARFGADIVASHQIALNIMSVFFMLPLSIGLASTIRIGYVLGQNDPERAKATVNSALFLGLSFAALSSITSYLLRYQFSSLYTNEIEVIQMAGDLMLLAAIFQFSDAAQVICGCALRGYKDAKAMFYLSFISYWGVGLTTGIILAMTDWVVPAMAARGFWIGFVVGLTAAAISLSLRLKWIQKKVLSEHYSQAI